MQIFYSALSINFIFLLSCVSVCFCVWVFIKLHLMLPLMVVLRPVNFSSGIVVWLSLLCYWLLLCFYIFYDVVHTRLQAPSPVIVSLIYRSLTTAVSVWSHCPRHVQCPESYSGLHSLPFGQIVFLLWLTDFHCPAHLIHDAVVKTWFASRQAATSQYLLTLPSPSLHPATLKPSRIPKSICCSGRSQITSTSAHNPPLLICNWLPNWL